jgi:two-component system phosphate regulon sensor histidine kinase PhoR
LRRAVSVPEQSPSGADPGGALRTQTRRLREPDREAVNTSSIDALSVTLTHELSAPMASVRRYIELLANGTAGRPEHSQSELLKQAQVDIERMQGILNNLVSLSALEGGTPALQPTALALPKVVEVALARCKYRLEDNRLQTRLEIGVLPTTRGDPNSVQQVVDNLVSHACRSARKQTTIGIQAYAQDDGLGTRQLRIAISYISSEANPEDATHPDGAHRRGPQESRAELEIAKALAETQQGRIWQESRPGVGERLHLSIPVAPRHPPLGRGNGRD